MKPYNSTAYLFSLLIIAGLASCRPDAKPVNNTGNHEAMSTTMTPQEKNALASLQWLTMADPKRDADDELRQASEQSRKPQLMAFAGRGLSYPGLNKDQLAAIKGKVGHKIAEGSGDVIYGSAHREMRKKLRAYAVAYNQAIFAGVQ